jgi:hypothetical protein
VVIYTPVPSTDAAARLAALTATAGKSPATR